VRLLATLAPVVYLLAALVATGCRSGATASEEEWLEGQRGTTLTAVRSLGELERSIREESLAGVQAGRFDQERLGSLIASAKVQAQTILAGLALSEAPTEQTRALADLLRSGAQHYSQSLDGLRDALAERYGSVRQAELSDASAKAELRRQRDIRAFTLKILEIGEVDLSAEADDALEFLDAYTRAEELDVEASAIDTSFLRELHARDASIRSVTRAASAARDAHTNYREALAGIAKPLDDGLAAALADELDAVDLLLESYEDLLDGIKARSVRLVRAAEKKRGAAFVALAEAPLKVQDAMRALALREESS
jgi:hypothetical protein